MKKVSKEVFDKFYEDNRESFSEVPKWKAKESSVVWYWGGSRKACMWIENSGIIDFYIDSVEVL